MNSDFSEIRRCTIFLRTIITRPTFLSQPLTRYVSRNCLNSTSNEKCKTSFFEWFEVKVCILTSEAVINDENHVFFLGQPVYLRKG